MTIFRPYKALAGTLFMLIGSGRLEEHYFLIGIVELLVGGYLVLRSFDHIDPTGV